MRHKGHVRGHGGGHGRELISKAVEMAKPLRNLEQVLLGVTSGNASALSLYQSLGFQIYGTEPKATQLEGKYLDDHLMVLFLDSK